jgi:hypothetical protein
MGDFLPTDSFWNIMNLFWSESRVDEWKKAIFSDQRTEICRNMITLTPTAHCFWGATLFAVKPLELSSDRKSLDVQFFWLRKYKSVKAGVLPSSKPLFPSGLDQLQKNIGLWNMETMTLIRSGDVIIFYTDNPDSHPLPVSSKE